jgi:rubrerythrin
MGIGPGKRAIENQKLLDEWLKKNSENYNSYQCPNHGLIQIRKDVDNSKCPLCGADKLEQVVL